MAKRTCRDSDNIAYQSGVTFAPQGIFVLAGNLDLITAAHECCHFEEAMHWLLGWPSWYFFYLNEIGVRFTFNMHNVFEYKLDFGRALHYAYLKSGAEVRAQKWATSRTSNP